MGAVLALGLAAATVVAFDGTVPAGQRLVARVNRNIATARALGPDRVASVTRAGQEFTATVEARFVDPHGRPILPDLAIVHGHVVRAERGFGLERARLELAIDRLDRWPIQARIAEVDEQQIASSDPGEHVDTVAFWGALMGGIAFGIPGVAVGYGAGGLSAGVNAARARHTDAWISAGSLMTIELTAPLHLSRCVATRPDGTC